MNYSQLPASPIFILFYHTMNVLSTLCKAFSINRQLIFKGACLVAWPMNENEAGDDLVLIETSLLFFIM